MLLESFAASGAVSYCVGGAIVTTTIAKRVGSEGIIRIEKKWLKSAVSRQRRYSR